MTVGQNCRYDISTGYQYGHIPWADADITVLVDERGGVKFCLQEICAKVRTQCSSFTLKEPYNQNINTCA